MVSGIPRFYARRAKRVFFRGSGDFSEQEASINQIARSFPTFSGFLRRGRGLATTRPQGRENLLRRGLGGEAVLSTQDRHAAVLDKLVGPADADNWSDDFLFRQM